jgi:hypothetical protein
MVEEKRQKNSENYRLYWLGRSKKVRQAVEYYLNSDPQVSLLIAAKEFDVSANSVGVNVRLLRKHGFVQKIDRKWVWM